MKTLMHTSETAHGMSLVSSCFAWLMLNELDGSIGIKTGEARVMDITV